jgi:hypothetical protein
MDSNPPAVAVRESFPVLAEIRGLVMDWFHSRPDAPNVKVVSLWRIGPFQIGPFELRRNMCGQLLFGRTARQSVLFITNCANENIRHLAEWVLPGVHAFQRFEPGSFNALVLQHLPQTARA